MRWTLTLLVMLILIPALGESADYYIDPQKGAPGNDGSADRPWMSLQQVIDTGLVESRDWDSLPWNEEGKLTPKNPSAPIKAGDTIWLRSGDYGGLTIRGFYNKDFITIAALPGNTPRFQAIQLQSSSYWALRGLHVGPERAADTKPGTLVRLASDRRRGPIHHILVEECVLQSARDTSSWSARDWNTRAWNGVEADGTRIILRGNRLKNVNFGISVMGSHALVEQNIIENFAGDGLRGLGDYGVFQYNLVKNCYDVNGNHDDGFQSWSRGSRGVGTGEVRGIVLRGNTIINYEDPEQPHRGTLQGIGCFDGTYVDWIIENNVVVVDHFHGITLVGARGCRIVNNTVIDPNNDRPGPPWISIVDHKNGTPSSGCTIRNNLAPALNVDPGEGMVLDHNLLVREPAKFFRVPSHHDLRLIDGSPAIDTGHRDLAPPVDITGTPRPQGKSVDVGAYEYPAPPRSK